MGNGKQVILIPQYLKKFSCIGSACEDTCCSVWTINIDKDTYLKYKRNKDTELMPIFDSMVKRRHNNKSDITYGKIVMDKDNSCPFLNEKKLCNIQGKLGVDYLSATCSAYPRFLNRVDGMLEKSATISCPEVARLVLLDPEGIIFEQVIEEISDKVVVNNVLDTEGHAFYNKPQRYFWDIRLFCLSILQNRNYSLGDCLIILGMFYKKIENLNESGETHNIPGFIEDYQNMIENNTFKDILENIEINSKIQMIIAKSLLGLKQSLSKRYNECLEETLLGLKYSEADMEEVSSAYKENYEKYTSAYMYEKEYILENYLVNVYFEELMPFGEFETIWDSYIFICAIYSMLKLHLVGMAGYHKGLTDELTVKLIQSFSKNVLHNRYYINSIVKMLKDNEFSSLAYMSILVKN